MNKAAQRRNRLMPNGVPKHIRCYDNGGETIDRYTVIFSSNFPGRSVGSTYLRCMSINPFHPQGVGSFDVVQGDVDRPSYGHLGKKVAFSDLSEQAQHSVRCDYQDIWGLRKTYQVILNRRGVFESWNSFFEYCDTMEEVEAFAKSKNLAPGDYSLKEYCYEQYAYIDAITLKAAA